MSSPFDPPFERHFFEPIERNPYFAPTPRGPRGLKKKIHGWNVLIICIEATKKFWHSIPDLKPPTLYSVHYLLCVDAPIIRFLDFLLYASEIFVTSVQYSELF